MPRTAAVLVGAVLTAALAGLPASAQKAEPCLAELLQGLQEWQLFAYGLLLAAVMFLMPQGFVGTAANLWTRFAPTARGRTSKPWPDCSVALVNILGGGRASTSGAPISEDLAQPAWRLVMIESAEQLEAIGTNLFGIGATPLVCPS